MTSLPGIAFGPAFPVIVTFDGAELCAYDADTEAPKWRLTLARPVAGVTIADPTAFGPDTGATPFRSGSFTAVLVAVDDEGRIHLVDPIAGRALREIDPVGAPRSIASSEASGSFAVATATEVILWTKGDKTAIPVRAWAAAFSHDGMMLGLGSEDGTLRVHRIVDGVEIVSVDTKDSSIVDLAHGTDGAWLVLTKRALVRIEGKDDVSRVDKIPGGQRLRYDAGGKRLAVQLSERQLLVYDWPTLDVVLRVEYTERPITGVAFGKGDWLGVAMDHGDGNKIDVAKAKVHRTDTHPGRQHRSWTLYVEGKNEPKPVTRPPVEDRPPPSLRNFAGGKGGRIGIGAIITFCLFGLRVCVRMGSTSSSSLSSSNYGSYTPPTATAPPRCDRACAEERIKTLQKTCREAGHRCESNATKALAAVTAGSCADAKAALDGITEDRATDPPLMGVEKLIAQLGLGEACDEGKIHPKKVTHAKLDHLRGSPAKWEPSEDVPELHAGEGEKARAIWTAPDGTSFVGTTVRTADGTTKAVVHRRAPSGDWSVVDVRTVAENDVGMRLDGRTATDVYAVIGGKLAHYDGATWSTVATPLTSVTNAAVTPAEIFVVGDGPDLAPEVHHGKPGAWTKDRKTPGLAIDELIAGGNVVWATGTSSGDDAVALRENGAWKVKALGDAGALSLLGAWASSKGDLLVTSTGAVYLTSAAGPWIALETQKSVRKMWGRSSTDVYGIGFAGLLHFDGKSWSEIPDGAEDAVALSGTAKDLFVLRADE